ncbi:MAG: CRISPR-associated protein Cas4 [Syntrophaceae bacterium]|nr:CRISPR-associated protein Cas4 [Syntrophaceae bacterium]
MLNITVGDVKQYFYCPRIVYFNYLMSDFRPVTYKMEEGKLRESEEERLEKRRTLSRFGFPSPDKAEHKISKVFHLKLSSTSLGLSGLLDMALIKDDEVIPVDFKDGSFSKGEIVSLHHKYQLMGYGLLLEETYKRKSIKGFIHSLEDGKTKSVYFSEGAKMFLKGKLRKIREMILDEEFPDETRYRGRCRECEFSPICKG